MTPPRYNTFVITEERESFLTDVRCVSELRCNRPYLIARAIVEGSKDRTIFSTRVSGVAKSRHWPAKVVRWPSWPMPRRRANCTPTVPRLPR